MSRILHLSDTHLDRMLGRHSRAVDIQAALAEVVSLVREHRPDLVIHSGDLFQGPRPSVEALSTAFNFLQEVAAIAPVVVVCGNHDSAALFGVLDRISPARIRFIDKVKSPDQGGILAYPGTHDERLLLAPLPFVHANRIAAAEAFDDSATWMSGYSDYISGLEQMLAQGMLAQADLTQDILLFAAHLHVSGAKFSGSERPMHISDAYGSLPQSLPPVAYAAFGHIHKPQALPGAVSGRFAGSIIQMDFGESGEEKGVVLVDLAPGRPAEINILPLRAGRRLRRLSGTIAELAPLATTINDEILRINVVSPTHEPGLTERILDLFPASATIIEINEECLDRKLTLIDETQIAAANLETDFVSLFQEFLTKSKTLKAPAQSVLDSFTEILNALETDSAPHLPELTALNACLAPEATDYEQYLATEDES